MNRRLAGLALCLSIATLPQFAMADNGKGKGAEMRDVIPGEQMRQGAGRSDDVRRDGPQRERREKAQRAHEQNNKDKQENERTVRSGKRSGGDGELLFARETARDGECADDGQKARKEHHQPKRDIQKRRVAVEASKGRAVVASAGAKGIQQLRKAVRAAV